jgi:di/tricarboxylate transporter
MKMASMIRRLAVVLGCLALAIIVFSTLSPLHLRPRTGHPDLERFAAFFLAGGCFAWADPRRWLGMLIAVVAVAAGLEVAQLFVPGRDAHLHDAMIKAAGGGAGVILGALVSTRIEALRRR